MKVAIVHDVLREFGGAEVVLLTLLEMYPLADVHTFYLDLNNSRISAEFGDRRIKSSILSQYPGWARLGKWFSLTKIFAWIYFMTLNLSEYDLVISSSHSFGSKTVWQTGRAVHICYLYTPPKYLYEELNELNIIRKFPMNVLFWPFRQVLKLIDKRSAQNPDVIVAISQEIRRRVKNYYGREAEVIYPPVEESRVKRESKKQKYYLSVSRLVQQKGIELLVKTSSKYGIPIKIVGEGQEKDRWLKLADPKYVEFLGWVPKENMAELYLGAKAFISCAIDEDFGLAVVEAMAAGVPVVAVRSGGIAETVTDRKTGVLFDQADEEGLYRAILKFESLKMNPRDCIEQAKKFSKRIFVNKMHNLINISIKNT